MATPGPDDPGYEAWIESKAGASPREETVSTPDPRASVIVSPSGMYHLKTPEDGRPRCNHYPTPTAIVFLGKGWRTTPLTWEEVLDRAQFHGTPAGAATQGQFRVCSDCWHGHWEKRD